MNDTLVAPHDTLLAEPGSFLEDHASFAAARPAGEPAAWRELRRAGRDRFAAVGLPAPTEESWRFTDVSALARTAFVRATPAHDGVTADDLAGRVIPGAACLVFVNGHAAPRLSAGPALPAGVVVTSLAAAARDHPELVTAHLGRHARIEDNPFTALNAAYLADGAFVHVPRGVVLAAPIQLLFVGRAAGTPLVSYPRNLVVAGENSQFTVVEQYIGLGPDYFTCVVTELVVADGAVVDHYKVQAEAPGAYHVATQQLHQGGASSFSSHAIHTGGRLVRNDVNAALVGPGGDCILNGLYMVHDRQLVDNHMWVEHVAPHCSSHELYKGILEDHARAVFNGRIKVRPGAQKTDAKQTNRNLILSADAVANSNPQLEIFANDVKCTHGSTVGQLDQDAVFYLRSRGIGIEAARSILTYAFAEDIVNRIKVPAVRREVEEFLFRRLPHGEVVRDAV
jgi:Fe-S cluster assembly protein SufD